MGTVNNSFQRKETFHLARMKIIFSLLFLGFVSMQNRRGEANEPNPPRRRGQMPGTGTALDWGFCSKANPCGVGQGDCDNDEQCQSGLTCAIDNCKSIHPNAHKLADCCIGDGSSSNVVTIVSSSPVVGLVQHALDCNDILPPPQLTPYEIPLQGGQTTVDIGNDQVCAVTASSLVPPVGCTPLTNVGANENEFE